MQGPSHNFFTHDHQHPQVELGKRTKETDMLRREYTGHEAELRSIREQWDEREVGTLICVVPPHVQGSSECMRYGACVRHVCLAFRSNEIASLSNSLSLQKLTRCAQHLILKCYTKWEVGAAVLSRSGCLAA